MVSSSIWCPAPNKAVEQELMLLPVWFGDHPSSTCLHLCHMYAHMGMHTWVCAFARSSTAAVLAVLHPSQPPFLLGPCASPLSHYCSGYRLSHFKRAHLFRETPSSGFCVSNGMSQQWQTSSSELTKFTKISSLLPTAGLYNSLPRNPFTAQRQRRKRKPTMSSSTYLESQANPNPSHRRLIALP